MSSEAGAMRPLPRAWYADLGLCALVVAVVAVCAAALGYLTAPAGQYGFGEQSEVYARHRGVLLAHVGLAAVSLAAGAQQLIALRFRAPGRLHRWTGRLYALSAVGAGIFGLVLAPLAWGGVSNRIAFALLAGLWILATAMAVRAAWLGCIPAHRTWIARSYALCMAGVMLRVEIPLLLAAGLSFDEAYRIVPWSSWVLNLVAVEWLRHR